MFVINVYFWQKTHNNEDNVTTVISIAATYVGFTKGELKLWLTMLLIVWKSVACFLYAKRFALLSWPVLPCKRDSEPQWE